MKKPRVYCSSDWHGCWDVAKKVFDYLQPDDILYYLGDFADRGPDGVKIFKTLISDPRVRMIKGNHDEMMREALPYIYAEMTDINAYHGDKFDLWSWNGGTVTREDLMLHCTPEEVYSFKKILDKMPTELRYTSPTGHTVIMEHAGYTPFSIPRKSHDPLWDREHFYDEWNNGWEWQPGSEVDKTYLVHGHTPVQYLKFKYGYNGEQPLTKEEMKQKQEWLHSHKMEFDWKPTILRYCDNHKFCVDLCTIASNRIALLDLDTFEEIYFDKEEN